MCSNGWGGIAYGSPDSGSLLRGNPWVILGECRGGMFRYGGARVGLPSL